MVDTYYVGLYPWVCPGEDVPEPKFDLGVDDQNRNRNKMFYYYVNEGNMSWQEIESTFICSKNKKARAEVKNFLYYEPIKWELNKEDTV
jgi:hypothetical protein